MANPIIPIRPNAAVNTAPQSTQVPAIEAAAGVQQPDSEQPIQPILPGPENPCTFTPPAVTKLRRPFASPSPGSYNGFVLVFIGSLDSDVDYFYTVNGDAPTRDSIPYGGIILIEATTTLRFFAVRAGSEDSDVVTATYVVAGLSVQASPLGGPYENSVTASLVANNEDAIIYYTTNGSDPNLTSPQWLGNNVYTQSLVLKYIAALLNGDVLSAIGQATYLIKNIAPGLEPNGTSINSRAVVITNTNPVGTVMRYTTTGLNPDLSSPIYDPLSPPVITATTTFKAAVFGGGREPSDVVTRVYDIKCADPVIQPALDLVPIGQAITITTTTPGAQIRYTLDGSTPTAASLLYSAPFVPTTDLFTVRAITIKTGLLNSDVATRNFSRVLTLPFLINQSVGSPYRSYDKGLTWLLSGHSGSFDVVIIKQGLEIHQLATSFSRRSFNYGQTWVTNNNNRPAGPGTTWDSIIPLVSQNGLISLAKANTAPFNQGLWISTDVFDLNKTQFSPGGSADTNWQVSTGTIADDGSVIMILNTSTNQLAVSVDFGATFVLSTRTGISNVKGGALLDTAFYITSSKQLFKSTNFGTTWSQLVSAPLFNRILVSQDPLLLFGVNTTTSGGGTVGTWRSEDGGVTWTSLHAFAINVIDRTGEYAGRIVNSPLPRRVEVYSNYGATFAHDTAPPGAESSISRINFGNNFFT